MVIKCLKIVFTLLLGGVLGYLITDPNRLQIETPIYFEKAVSSSAPEYTNESLGVDKANFLPSVAELVKMPTSFERNLNAHLLAAAASEQSLNHIIGDLITEKDNAVSLEILLILFNRFVELNPHRAVLFLTDNVPSTHHHFDLLLNKVFYEWFRLDSGAALARLQELEPSAIREKVVEYLAIKGEFIDIPELAHMINGLSDLSRYKIILESVQKKDPAQAFEELIVLKNRDRSRGIAIYLAIEQWVRKAPEEAYSRILQLENSGQRSGLMVGVLQAWASVDPEAALLAVFEDGDEIDNGPMTVLMAAGRSNGLEAVELVGRYSARLGDRAMYKVLTGWAVSDVRAAAKYVEANGLVTNNNIIKYALQSYGREYPREAYEWGVRVGVTTQGMKGIVSMVASNNPLEAEQIMLELPIGSDRDQFLRSIASRKVDSSPTTAMVWLEQYKGERSYNRALSAVVSRWGYQDPARAAEELLKINDDKLYRDIAPNLVQRWYTKDPQEVAEWVYSSTEGVLRDQALGALAQASFADDKDKSQEFLDSIGSSNARALIEAKIKGR